MLWVLPRTFGMKTEGTAKWQQQRRTDPQQEVNVSREYIHTAGQMLEVAWGENREGKSTQRKNKRQLDTKMTPPCLMNWTMEPHKDGTPSRKTIIEWNV